MNSQSSRSPELETELVSPLLSGNRRSIARTAILLTLIFVTVLGFTHLAPREISIELGLAAGFAAVIGVQLALYRRTQQTLDQQQTQIQTLLNQQFQQSKDYPQTEALFSIFAQINPRSPLPQMRDWAASPDFLKLVISVIQEYQPQCIVEAGSGVSTLISGYCLESLSQSSQPLESGQVIALDHDLNYAEQTQKTILNHQLQNFAKALYSPLKKFGIGGRDWLWYDTDRLPSRKVDLLIVDGPPWYTQSLARYPALPLLFDALSDDAIVLLDDADRPDEQQIIQQWQKEFPCCHVHHFQTEKGACLIQIKK